MEEPVELYRRFRPTDWTGLVGQVETVKILDEKIKKNKLPHALLFSGSSGCGKTTTARILRKKLGCSNSNYVEINAAESRGIDTIRSIKQVLGLAPMGGTCKMYVIDECFPANTLVQTPDGPKAIQTLRKGDFVNNVCGEGVIEQVFENRVQLSRILKVKLSDGSEIVTTKQHQFWTEFGWVEAQNLLKMDLLRVFCYPKGYENSKNMSFLPDHFYKSEEDTGMLLKELCSEIEGTTTQPKANRDEVVSPMWGLFQDGNMSPKTMLQQKLCGNQEKFSSRLEESLQTTKTTRSNQPSPYCFLQYRTREKECCETVSTKTRKTYATRMCGQDDSYQNQEWNSLFMDWKKRREWTVNRSPDSFMESIRSELESGTSDKNQEKTQRWIPSLLQSRLSKKEVQNSRRNRWEGSSVEMEFTERCQKDQAAARVRVESIEVYQQGSNDESFKSVIGDKERNKGYALFYDLQISRHHSYFAEGFLVHNCHKLTGDAQSSLLKMLEDCPSHVYFILATTEPEGLIPTIKTRCTQLSFKPITGVDLGGLLNDVSIKANISLSSIIAIKIITASEGSARKALVLLEKIAPLETDEQRIEAIESEQVNKQSEFIAKLLINRKPWTEVAKALKELESKGEEPEKVRRSILGYAKAVLLNGNKKGYFLLDAFDSNLYSSGFPGLVRCCFYATQLE